MAHKHTPGGQEKIETSNFLMIVLILLVAAVGGLVEIVPLFFQRSTTQPVEGLKPYTALQLSGRDIYIREGCYNCHSQMIRPLRGDTLRYGPFSKAGEFVYDHPFQWGSKRTGPDLAREGAKRDLLWQVIHLRNPRDMDENSLMPSYTWLFEQKYDIDALPKKIAVQRMLGVPYEPMSNDEIKDKARAQALEIHNVLKGQQTWVEPDSDIVPLVAYLKKLGTWKEVKAQDPAQPPMPEAPHGGFLPGDPDSFRPAPAAATIHP